MRVTLFFLASLAGCSDPDIREGSGFEVLDSAGIVMATTSGTDARAATNWVIDTLPDLQIGAESGQAAYQFHNIGGMATDGDRIWVLDGGSREARIFDGSGGFQRSFGGRGDGPGEFRSPRMVRRLTTDTLIFLDHATRRFHVFSKMGELLTTSPSLQLARVSPLAVGSVGGRVLLFDSGTLFIAPGGLDPPEKAIYYVVDARAGTADTLGEFPGRQMWTDARGEIKAVGSVPFDIRPSAAAGKQTFFITPGEGPEVLEFDTLGTLIRILRVDEPVRRVTKQDLDRFIEARIAINGEEWAGYLRSGYEELPLTEIMPSFQSLLVDTEGWLWAQTYEPFRAIDDPAKWMVFEPGGMVCGTVRMPASLQIHQIGADFVLGLWRDDLDVQHLRRHQLVRRDCGAGR
jgi:hypothetical protein